MAARLTTIALPSQLRYDQGEYLEGGAQFYCLRTLDSLRAVWAELRASMRYAAVGTGANHPAHFLGRHEWVFAPSKAALITAVVRWDEFKIAPRWYDAMSDERTLAVQLQDRREVRRARLTAEGKWTREDETAFQANSRFRGKAVRFGFWRLTGLPCGLTHFDWFSERAELLGDPSLDRPHVDYRLRQVTFDDWHQHSTVDDVSVMKDLEVDADIEYWERERCEGREPYEGEP